MAPISTPPLAKTFRALLAAAALAAVTQAQRGDQKGEIQPPPPTEWKIPESPVLDPVTASSRFVVEPGYVVELVAAEPLVEDPVDAFFDERGRLIVLEMRGYMPDIDGFGEDAPVGALVVLEDLDGDGRMDVRHTFADDLILPRGVAPVPEGFLVIEPPYLKLLRDVDGDGDYDDERILADGFGGRHNPEHAGNGLRLGRDNWLELAKHPAAFRWRGGTLEAREQPPVGQWGLAFDDEGRSYFNTNSDGLRVAVVPPHLAGMHPGLGVALGGDIQALSDQRVWPARITPGVNRGYRRGTLTPEGRLATCTAACGPFVLRDSSLGADLLGAAFFCEPAGNLVKAVQLTEAGLRVSGRSRIEGREFLASTDERFRPVNLASDPAGGLIVVDFHRGVVQHATYVTTYLRRQVEQRSLEQPLGLGRIYRVRKADVSLEKRPDLSGVTGASLVAFLLDPRGVVRDLAQRCIVQRNDRSAIPALRELLSAPSGPTGERERLARLHALWCLEGLDALPSAEGFTPWLSDADPRLRRAAVRIAVEAARGLADPSPWLRWVAPATADGDLSVRRQLVLSLGEINAPIATLVVDAVADALAHRELREASIAAAHRREDAIFLAASSRPEFAKASGPRAEWLRALARSAAANEDPTGVQRLLAALSEVTESRQWQLVAVLEGIAASRGSSKRPRPLRLTREPRVLAAESIFRDSRLGELRSELGRFVTWPGGPNASALALRPLNVDEQERFERGRRQYAFSCSGCHQTNGQGAGGLAPPLAGSEWVEAPADRLLRVAMHGVTGPLTVKGQVHQLEMPASGLDDERLADVATFVRRAFGNEGDPVGAEEVRRVRQATADRRGPWTEAELRVDLTLR